jgi:predicted nucleic acid-binding protein
MYADSSALVKLVIKEPESTALKEHLAKRSAAVLATSRLATVEVARACKLVNASLEVADEAERVLASCLQVAVSSQLLQAASKLTTRKLRSLDAIHLATALRIRADELLAYDRRLLDAAGEHGLAVAHPSA